MTKLTAGMMLLYAAVSGYCIETDRLALGVGFALLAAVWPFMPWLDAKYREYREKHRE